MKPDVIDAQDGISQDFSNDKQDAVTTCLLDELRKKNMAQQLPGSRSGRSVTNEGLLHMAIYTMSGIYEG